MTRRRGRSSRSFRHHERSPGEAPRRVSTWLAVAATERADVRTCALPHAAVGDKFPLAFATPLLTRYCMQLGHR